VPNYTQDNRLIQITTPLGKDVLLLQSFSGREEISGLFQFDLVMHSENSKISFDSIVGEKATVKIVLPSEKERYINGVISSFWQGGSSPLQDGKTPAVFTEYRATLVPWLWFLTRTRDCRIFQGLSVPDIIEKVFKDHGFSDFKKQLEGNYPKRDYCVQYRETDFNFISRLMEKEGIFYFFEHEKDKHTLVLADHPSKFRVSPHHPEVSYTEQRGEDQVVTEWNVRYEVRPGKYALRDFNFEQPSLDLTASATGKDKRKYEVYDYPGDYASKDRGNSIADLRMQEEETPIVWASGSSTCRGLAAGQKFKLKQHYRPDLNQEYILTAIYHAADQGSNYRSSATEAGAAFSYRNQLECIPSSTPFRPRRVTPVPVIHGSQTAIVVGKQGEEIWTDKYGRVKVQFHWDREGKHDENSSCWVRVSQPWAGKGWGSIWIPRIGQEVIVDFLEGDPDRPIITGRVYNAEQMPPYELPANQTRSTFRSRSSKQGGSGNYNEIRFEDKKDAEQIYIHAERDLDVRVKASHRESVGGGRHLTVGGNHKELVKHDRHRKVLGNQFILVEGENHQHVKLDHLEKIDGNMSLDVGMNRDEKVGQKYAVDSGMEIHLKAGMKVVIEGGMQLSLKGPGGFIDIGPAGVAIQGTMVLINSGGAAGAGSGSSPQAPKDPEFPDGADDGSKGDKTSDGGKGEEPQ